MGIGKKLWQADPDNKPVKRTTTSDRDGSITIGMMEDGQPIALDTFRFTTGKQEVADAVALLFGGSVVEGDVSKEEFLEVVTSADKLLVVADSPSALDSDYKKWDGGQLTHHCDGDAFLSHPVNEDLIGSPCGCPRLFQERKDAANAKIGPKPDIWLTCRLADDPDLGTFRFRTGSWTLAKVLHEVEDAFDMIGGAALVELSLTLVEYTPKKGKMRNKLVSFYQPGIKILKSWNDAISD